MLQATEKRCVLVLGMHNSGTSLLGNLMHAAGLPLGPDLLLRDRIPEDRRPRYDYFEDDSIVQLQDQCLLDLQRHWSSYRSAFQLPEREHPAREHFRNALASLLPSRFQHSPLWLVKDPRSAILVEDWLEVLHTLGIQPCPLVVHRDPTSNIRSFSSKGQVPPLWAEALWQRTYAQGLAAVQQVPDGASAFTSFERLMSQPAEEIGRLCTWLQWPLAEAVQSALAQRVDRSLPTEPLGRACDRPNNPGAPQADLHPATQALRQCLERQGRGSHNLPPLLADSLSQAAAQGTAPLELNRVLQGEQTLLPKVDVTIVTSELQGWGGGGGIGSALRELAETLRAAGHRVDVLLVQPGSGVDGPELKGVGVHRLDSSGCSRLELVRQVAAWLRNHNSDVVHLHDWLGLASGLKEALQPHPPQLVVGLHGPSAWARSGNPWPQDDAGALLADESQLFDEGLVRALEVDGLRQADWLVSPSQAMAHWVSEHLLHGTRPAHLVVNRNCPLPQRLQATGANQTPEGERVDCVYFGRMEQRKGLKLFLDALQGLEPAPERVLFLGTDCVVGLQANGEPLWGSQLVRDQLQGTGIATQHEQGLLRDAALQRLMELQAVVVIPSLIENSPCVVEELLDSGLTMVVTDVGGSAELVRAQDRRWLSAADAPSLRGHLQAALMARETGSEDYQLASAVESWRIQQSWQAFHERLPRRLSPLPLQEPAAEAVAEPLAAAALQPPLWRRATGKAKRLGGKVKRKLKALVGLGS